LTEQYPNTMKYVASLIFFTTCFVISAQKQYSDSLETYRQISSILEKGIDEALNNNTTECYRNFDEAYQISLANKLYNLIPVIIIAQSRLYLLEENFDDAILCIKKTESYITNNKNTSLAGDYYEFLGQCYLHQRKLEDALESFKISDQIRSRIEPAKNWRTYNGMARAYKLLNDIDQSEKYSAQAARLSKIQNSRRIILDLKSELKFDEQSGTIAYLSQENLKAKIEIQKSKIKFIILLSILGLFISLSIMLIILLRQRSKYNREIANKNQIISKNLAEKDILMQEIHHRVKNNLQLISSLLSLQSRIVDDKKAADALLQSQSRVISISLIHETLYKEDPSTQADLKEYLTSLSQRIFETYNIQGDKIKLSLDLQHTNMDVGDLIPLGLIINELITNSLKHAFAISNEGCIWISSYRKENSLYIKIKDNGTGIESAAMDSGFGTKLIDTFSKRLNAQIERNYSDGTEVIIILPNYFNVHA